MLTGDNLHPNLYLNNCNNNKRFTVVEFFVFIVIFIIFLGWSMFRFFCPFYIDILILNNSVCNFIKIETITEMCQA